MPRCELSRCSYSLNGTAVILRLIQRLRREDRPPPPPKRESNNDNSSMADLVRLLREQKEPAE